MKPVWNAFVTRRPHARLNARGGKRRAHLTEWGFKVVSGLLLFGTIVAGVANSRDPTAPHPPEVRSRSEFAPPFTARTEFASTEVPTPETVRDDFELPEPSERLDNETPAEAAVPRVLVPGVVVPEITDVSLGEARQLARLAGLPLVVGVYYVAPDRWRDDIRPDRLYLQSLPAGRAVPAGTSLAGWKLVKAQPSRHRLTMPSLQGLTRSEAIARLKPLDLPLLEQALGRSNRLVETEEATDGRTVISQYPPAGRELFEGTEVLFMLAEEELSGPPPPIAAPVPSD